jgi:hypothetical protein
MASQVLPVPALRVEPSTQPTPQPAELPPSRDFSALPLHFRVQTILDAMLQGRRGTFLLSKSRVTCTAMRLTRTLLSLTSTLCMRLPGRLPEHIPGSSPAKGWGHLLERCKTFHKIIGFCALE